MIKNHQEKKPSGAPWLGNIPSQWECLKIGSLFLQRKTKVSDKEYPPLSVTKKGILPQLDTAAKSNDGDNRKLVKAGDFVINSRSDRKGSCGVSDREGSVSLINIVLEPNSALSHKYVHYLLRSQPFSEEYYRYGRGIVADLWTTRFSEMKNILIPIPPLSEQDQIVRFLDWKVSSINKLINIRTNEINKLEELKRSKILNCVMGQENDVRSKLSSISWVKNIPYNWNEEMLIQVAEEQKIKNVGLAETNLLSLSYGKIIEKDINTTEGLLPASFEGYQIVYPGNIILRLTDLQNDRKSLRTGISTTKGIITSAYTCLKVRDNIFPEYLHLQLHSADLCKVFYGMGGGVRQSIGFKEIRNLIIAIPPIEEQRRLLDVAKLIDNQSNLLMEKYKEQISALNDLKQRLISDVVTGQIDVRNIEIPEYEYVEEKSDSDSDDIDGDFDSEEISEEA